MEYLTHLEDPVAWRVLVAVVQHDPNPVETRIVPSGSPYMPGFPEVASCVSNSPYEEETSTVWVHSSSSYWNRAYCLGLLVLPVLVAVSHLNWDHELNLTS